MPTSRVETPTLPGLEPAPRVRVAFLGSGSSGNATAVAWGDTLLLVDCGFSARETKRRLEAVGLGGRSIDAILLTHEHNDHVSGLRVLTKRAETRVFATDGTWGSSRIETMPDHAETTRAGETFRVGGIEVRVFEGSHDAPDTVGYVLEAGGRRLGLCTDCGRLPDEALEALAGCDLLGIETNHDVTMLEHGPYPYFLKRRILSAQGHLSNEQAARALGELACDRLKTIVGLHLSRTNNDPGIARRTLRARAAGLGLQAEVHVASQVEPLVCELLAEEN